jgi:glycosyltransferase involved in cell wall biosynthesis
VGPNETVAVAIGRLDYQKGIDWLLESWRSVERAIPPARLLLVGDGPQRRQLERLANRLQLDRVTFAGYRTDVPAVLAASDLLGRNA